MHRLVASLFGSGLILRRVRGSDAGSGTVGGLVALPFALLIGETWGWVGQLVAAVLLTVVAFWSSTAIAASEGDAGWIVIDEAAGTFVSTIGLLGWPALAAFVVFRVADITKRPFPGVHQADSLPGAAGIALDDLVAGLWALGIGHLLNATVF
jgi:phosphatidylglycerophosphatase A